MELNDRDTAAELLLERSSVWDCATLLDMLIDELKEGSYESVLVNRVEAEKIEADPSKSMLCVATAVNEPIELLPAGKVWDGK
jgi:hypothetical protein